MSSVNATDLQALVPLIVNKLLYVPFKVHCKCPELLGRPVATGLRCEIPMGECGPEVAKCKEEDDDFNLCTVDPLTFEFKCVDVGSNICVPNPCLNDGICLGHASNNIQADIIVIAHGSPEFNSKVGGRNLGNFIDKLYNVLDMGWTHNARIAGVLADQTGNYRHRQMWFRFSSLKEEMNLHNITIESRILSGDEFTEFGIEKGVDMMFEHGRPGAHCAFLILTAISEQFTEADNHGFQIFTNQTVAQTIGKCNVHVLNINDQTTHLLTSLSHRTLTTVPDFSAMMNSVHEIQDTIYKSPWVPECECSGNYFGYFCQNLPEKFINGPEPENRPTCSENSCEQGECIENRASFKEKPVEFVLMLEKSPKTFNRTLPHLKDFLKQVVNLGELKFSSNLWRMTIITFFKVRKVINGKRFDSQESETLLELDDPIFNLQSFEEIRTEIDYIIDNMQDIDSNFKDGPWAYKPVIEATNKLATKMRSDCHTVTLFITTHTKFAHSYFNKMVDKYNEVNNYNKNIQAGLPNKVVVVYFGFPNNFDGNQRNFYNEVFQPASNTDETYGFSFADKKSEIKTIFEHFALPHNIIMSSTKPVEMRDLADVVIDKLLYVPYKTDCKCPDHLGRPVSVGLRCEIPLGTCGPGVAMCRDYDTDHDLCVVDPVTFMFKCDCPPCRSGPLCEDVLELCTIHTFCGFGECSTSYINEGRKGEDCEAKCICEDQVFVDEFNQAEPKPCTIANDPCETNECNLDNSVCNVIDDVGQCVCEPCWTGRLCDRPLDLCSEKMNPCKSGSRCRMINQCTETECACMNFCFTGAFCDMPVDTCDSNPCQNGGTCVMRSDCSFKWLVCRKIRRIDKYIYRHPSWEP